MGEDGVSWHRTFMDVSTWNTKIPSMPLLSVRYAFLNIACLTRLSFVVIFQAYMRTCFVIFLVERHTGK
jgi:hypothetical protein